MSHTNENYDSIAKMALSVLSTRSIYSASDVAAGKVGTDKVWLWDRAAF